MKGVVESANGSIFERGKDDYMAKEIRMPKMGISESDMTLTEWKKNPGDVIKAGDVIAIVEGAKLTSDLEADADGVLGAHLVEEGQEVPINTLLTTIE
jgi:pyruvate dehydrogenase E2 component (dihydrolipoamide acetyltransferase)